MDYWYIFVLVKLSRSLHYKYNKGEQERNRTKMQKKINSILRKINLRLFLLFGLPNKCRTFITLNGGMDMKKSILTNFWFICFKPFFPGSGVQIQKTCSNPLSPVGQITWSMFRYLLSLRLDNIGLQSCFLHALDISTYFTTLNCPNCKCCSHNIDHRIFLLVYLPCLSSIVTLWMLFTETLSQTDGNIHIQDKYRQYYPFSWDLYKLSTLLNVWYKKQTSMWSTNLH